MKLRRLLVIGISALASAVALTFVTQQARMAAPITQKIVVPAAKVPAMMRSLRPNYPYSIIPGGAYSPAELRIVNERDPLVREHYADFDVRAARLVMLTEDRYQYVSFKLNNRIFWTRKKLRIPKGEMLLTDGHSYARTRCGNRLSSIPKQNTTTLVLPEKLLSLPEFKPELMAQLPSAPAITELAQQFPTLPMESERLAPVLPMGTPASIAMPPSWPPLQIAAPIIPLAPGYAPTPTPTTPTAPVTPVTPPTTPVIPPTAPIAPIPEPGTVWLLGIGFAGMFVVGMRRKLSRLN